jgi:hypothetical protein
VMGSGRGCIRRGVFVHGAPTYTFCPELPIGQISGSRLGKNSIRNHKEPCAAPNCCASSRRSDWISAARHAE